MIDCFVIFNRLHYGDSMAKTNKDHDAINNHVDNASDVIKETDPFASLNKMLEENPEF